MSGLKGSSQRFYKHRAEGTGVGVGGSEGTILGAEMAEATPGIMAILGWALGHHQAPRPSS